MSTEFKQSAVSSISSIISSIENDRQVYRWFLLLITSAEIQQMLSREAESIQKYLTLKKIQLTEMITYMVLAFIIAASCLTKQPWLLALNLFPIVILINLFHKNRQCVALISKKFLLENIPSDELNQQTLFQTCEYLSKKFKILSLVDIINYQDYIGRRVLLASIFVLLFILHLKTWQTAVTIIAISFAAAAIVNTSFILRKLK